MQFAPPWSASLWESTPWKLFAKCCRGCHHPWGEHARGTIVHGSPRRGGISRGLVPSFSKLPPNETAGKTSSLLMLVAWKKRPGEKVQYVVSVSSYLHCIWFVHRRPRETLAKVQFPMGCRL